MKIICCKCILPSETCLSLYKNIKHLRKYREKEQKGWGWLEYWWNLFWEKKNQGRLLLHTYRIDAERYFSKWVHGRISPQLYTITSATTTKTTMTTITTTKMTTTTTTIEHNIVFSVKKRRKTNDIWVKKISDYQMFEVVSLEIYKNGYCFFVLYSHIPILTTLKYRNPCFRYTGKN